MVSMFANGDYDQAFRSVSEYWPNIGVFGSRIDPDKAVARISEHAVNRKLYVHDAHGHYVRKDTVNENRECLECLAENARVNAFADPDSSTA
jgi:hypothetical protein